MKYFLLRTRLTPETWARLLRSPEDRRIAAREGAEDYGGELVGYWYSTGRYDCYSLIASPDETAPAALHAALYSSGAFLEFNPTALMTVEQMREAVKKADEWPTLRNYRAPGRIGGA
jgi:uncharacterized protein with GYD domain